MLANRRSLLALLGAAALSATGFVVAGHRHGPCCPRCDKVCCPTPEMIKEKKHCWQVECKEICIPAIKGPFAPCCEAPKCGHVRTVKVLKKVEYECEHCGYKWNVFSKGCDCCK